MKDEAGYLREVTQGLLAEVEHWKGMLAIVLKANGGALVLARKSSDVQQPYEIVMRRVDEEGTIESAEIELRLLEGKEQIEEVMGKPSPIIVPK
jgi:hypothetical protein